MLEYKRKGTVIVICKFPIIFDQNHSEMKNIFGLIVLFLLAFSSTQAQNRQFPKGKHGGDIIGKQDVRFEVVNNGSTAYFYPVNAAGEAIENAPEKATINVLYLGETGGQTYEVELQEGRYAINLDPEKVVHVYGVNAQNGTQTIEMKEKMVEHGK